MAQLGRRLRSEGGDRRRRDGRGSRGLLQASRREMCHKANKPGEVEHQHGRAAERNPGIAKVGPFYYIAGYIISVIITMARCQFFGSRVLKKLTQIRGTRAM